MVLRDEVEELYIKDSQTDLYPGDVKVTIDK
jgi:hypothetical protein